MSFQMKYGLESAKMVHFAGKSSSFNLDDFSISAIVFLAHRNARVEIIMPSTEAHPAMIRIGKASLIFKSCLNCRF